MREELDPGRTKIRSTSKRVKRLSLLEVAENWVCLEFLLGAHSFAHSLCSDGSLFSGTSATQPLSCRTPRSDPPLSTCLGLCYLQVQSNEFCSIVLCKGF